MKISELIDSLRQSKTMFLLAQKEFAMAQKDLGIYLVFKSELCYQLMIIATLNIRTLLLSKKTSLTSMDNVWCYGNKISTEKHFKENKI
uniref:HEPN domain-containing protein n=1 Tax=Romanomermis culicivorax TaxID=13658 RepID=A0A915J3L5_ROMCU